MATVLQAKMSQFIALCQIKASGHFQLKTPASVCDWTLRPTVANPTETVFSFHKIVL